MMLGVPAGDRARDDWRIPQLARNVQSAARQLIHVANLGAVEPSLKLLRGGVEMALKNLRHRMLQRRVRIEADCSGADCSGAAADHIDPSILKRYTHISQATSTSFLDQFTAD